MGLLDESAKRPGRRRGPLLLLLFLVLIVFVFNASTWFILSRATESLDEEQRERVLFRNARRFYTI